MTSSMGFGWHPIYEMENQMVKTTNQMVKTTNQMVKTTNHIWKWKTIYIYIYTHIYIYMFQTTNQMVMGKCPSPLENPPSPPSWVPAVGCGRSWCASPEAKRWRVWRAGGGEVVGCFSGKNHGKMRENHGKHEKKHQMLEDFSHVALGKIGKIIEFDRIWTF